MEEAEKFLICRRYYRTFWSRPPAVTKSSSFKDIFDECRVHQYSLSDFLRTLLKIFYQLSIKWEPHKKDGKRYDKYGNEIKSKQDGLPDDEDGG